MALEKIYKIQSITTTPFVLFPTYLKTSKSSGRELHGKRVCNLLCMNIFLIPQAGVSFHVIVRKWILPLSGLLP